MEKTAKYIMSSPADGKQCDIFPFGSIHEATREESGLRLTSKRDHIPSVFSVMKLDATLSGMETKKCPSCNNTFLKMHPFVDSRQKGEAPTCIRCYERKHIIDRENYRKAVIHELHIEMLYFS